MISNDGTRGAEERADSAVPRAQSVAGFAQRLRTLRLEAGSPPFRRLAALTHYSASTLADATAGKRLPTEAVVKAFVTACGADPAAWLEDLRRVAQAAAEQPGPSEPGGPGGSSALEGGADAAAGGAEGSAGSAASGTGRVGRRRYPLAVVAAGAGALLLVGGAVGWALHQPPAPQPSGPAVGVAVFAGTPAPAPTARVVDGEDPDVAGCSPDSVLVDKVPVMSSGVQIGALELRYSPRCGAGWARLYLYPGEPTMMGEVSVYSGDGRLSAFSDPLVRQIDDYTDVVVPDRGGCLGAQGVVYQGGRAAVYASIPCQSPTAG